MSWLWNKPSAGSPVPLLLQRLRTCTTLSDKREALQHLTEQPANDLALVGGDGLILLLQTLAENLQDTECAKRVLELLMVVTEDTSGSSFLEIFVQSELKGANLLLAALRNAEFYVRFPAVQLLTRLLEHNPKLVIEQILTDPNGVGLLVDVLDEQRESVRNEGLLLLKALVATDGDMRQIVAFTNAFERLFHIINEEGGADGTIVVEDCIAVMCSIVENDVALRSFREMRYCKWLYPLMTAPVHPGSTGRRPTIVISVMRFLLLLVQGSRTNELNTTKDELCDCRLVDAILDICSQADFTASVHLQALRTLAPIVDNFPRAQKIVMGHSLDDEKGPVLGMVCILHFCTQRSDELQQVAMDVILKVMVNPTAQLFIVSGVKPLTAGAVTCGQVLATALIRSNSTSSFLVHARSALHASAILTTAIQNNLDAKRVLLKASWGTGEDGTVMPFMHSMLRSLQQVIREGSSQANSEAITAFVVGLFRVLLVWLADFPEGVAFFLADKSSFLFFLQSAISSDESIHIQGLSSLLIGEACVHCPENVPSVKPAEAATTRGQLFDHLVRRLGIDQFTTKWNHLRNHPSFQSHPQHESDQTTISSCLYDESFCTFLQRLFESIDSCVQDHLNGKAFTEATPADGVPDGKVSPIPGLNDPTISSYQRYIKSQEEQINQLRRENEQLRTSAKTLRTQEASVSQQQRDRDIEYHRRVAEVEMLTATMKKHDQTIARQAAELAELRKVADQREQMLAEERKKAAIQKSLSEESITSLNRQIAAYESEIKALSQTYTLLEQTLAQKERELQRLSKSLGLPVDVNGPPDGQSTTGPPVLSTTPSSLLHRGASEASIATSVNGGGWADGGTEELFACIGELSEQLRLCQEMLISHGLSVPSLSPS